jgi:hypothetical protein
MPQTISGNSSALSSMYLWRLQGENRGNVKFKKELLAAIRAAIALQAAQTPKRRSEELQNTFMGIC